MLYIVQMNINSDSMDIKRVFGDDVTEELFFHARDHKWKLITTISDSNTYPLIGQRIQNGLQTRGIRNINIILNGNNLIADERSIMLVLTEIDIETDALVAVGSGTITDIVRFVSHRLRKSFISVPTAPSVEGYTSIAASLIIKGCKRSIICHEPSLLIASPSIFTSAPHNLIVAGFGNIMAKVTAVADWELANLLTDAPFDKEIAANTYSVYTQTVEIAEKIGRREAESITTLFKALTTTGESMKQFGSEHHIAHFLEMRRIATNSPTVLHGIKVAFGTIISAQWYRTLRNTNRDMVAQQMTKLPDLETDVADIGKLLGEPGAILLEGNTFISTLDVERVAQIRRRLIEHWTEVQDIAERVPEPEQLAELLKMTGGPTSPNDVGITAEEMAVAAHLSHYVQNSFTIKTLLFTLGLPSEIEFKYY